MENDNENKENNLNQEDDKEKATVPSDEAKKEEGSKLAELLLSEEALKYVSMADNQEEDDSPGINSTKLHNKGPEEVYKSSQIGFDDKGNNVKDKDKSVTQQNIVVSVEQTQTVNNKEEMKEGDNPLNPINNNIIESSNNDGVKEEHVEKEEKNEDKNEEIKVEKNEEIKEEIKIEVKEEKNEEIPGDNKEEINEEIKVEVKEEKKEEIPEEPKEDKQEEVKEEKKDFKN